MYYKAGNVRDAFTFSLGGMATIASVVSPPIIADDRINEILDARTAKGAEPGPDLPLFSQISSAQLCCA